MAKGTRAIDVLRRAGVEFSVHEYQIGETDLSYGEAAAASLGVDSGRVLKTLVAMVDGNPVVGVVPVSRHLSMKRLARAVGGKKATMAEPSDAQRLTGYVVGGISPFGQRRRLPVFVDATAVGYDTIFVSAGRRGLQVEVTPADLMVLTRATEAPIAE
ncbi:cys-tRNA(Pro)/Cys-tRNA(Cys) deacylase YbaK [bacterium BMS3Abin02]|nr:cys-tRNA(Pro)/Cys-tRNA(Cys) deacylase YbaK [bacterium BMS3Abin02]GBE21861.1 cys-tRNA(Pro)/Cys-tRNA(Cys) deacylase YbaK [bacterium BMS3Bbin01]HDH25592.1 Cys-tRNA(Pro) deacylase [Actinomycetota bacterium]HDK45306.1 Cys-tRNA(Pro) deacylase [Actinomycetota bacterium]HDL50266.1 Cys-tRNA(Pro) deacylase [Actinomycetota bacterium]